MSVLHASRDERVHGLFLFSPALEITARARWANLHKLDSWLLPQAAWMNSALPEQRILSSAHTAIVIPPQEVLHGEAHPKNLQRGLLRRLTYNPHYAALEVSMQKFIERLP